MGDTNADHSDAKKEVDVMRASTVQTGHLVQTSQEVNGNDIKWKQVADS
jgi:hypothetical protein